MLYSTCMLQVHGIEWDRYSFFFDYGTVLVNNTGNVLFEMCRYCLITGTQIAASKFNKKIKNQFAPSNTIDILNRNTINASVVFVAHFGQQPHQPFTSIVLLDTNQFREA